MASSSLRRTQGSNLGGLTLPEANSSRRRLRIWLIWGFLSVICGFLDWNGIQGVGFSKIDSYFYEMQVKLSARRNADVGAKVRQQIVIVPIRDNTFDPNNPEHLDGPPVSRAAYARVLRDLKAAGARSVVFDVVFKRPGDPKIDQELIDAAKQPGAPTVWACLTENEDWDSRLALPLAGLEAASPHVGHILSLQESDGGIIKRLPTVCQIDGRTIPALSIVASMGAKNAEVQRTATGWRIGSLSLPDTFNIQYVSDPDEESDNKFPTVPFEQVARGAARNDPFYVLNHFFKDKIVIIGDETELSNDLRNTPVGFLKGVEIQANAIASVLMAESGTHPLAGDVPSFTALAILTFLCGLTVLVTACFSPLKGALCAMGIGVAYLLIEAETFVDTGLILHTTGPIVVITLAALFVFLERGMWEEREKTYMRELLGRYVSPSVADFILRHPERCALGGEEINATVLFADIRGFTALTESFPPRVTLRLLNDYFQAMSDVVFAHDGMVDKFMGDAIMAIFGAPIETEDHSTRALSAAIQMLERIDALQASWRQQGLPPIVIGIGIGTGTMIVGNMGSEARADFSVIGDAVNLAARLQDLNKEMGTTILISATTRAACDEASLPVWATIEESHRVQIRGHAGEEDIFPVSVNSIRTI